MKYQLMLVPSWSKEWRTSKYYDVGNQSLDILTHAKVITQEQLNEYCEYKENCKAFGITPKDIGEWLTTK